MLPSSSDSSSTSPSSSGTSRISLANREISSPITLASLIASLESTCSTHRLPILLLSSFTLGSILTLFSIATHRQFFRRLPNTDWITPDILVRKRWVKGVVVNVGDADNFRLYHTPGIGWHWPLKFRRIPSSSRDLKHQTLHIRMAGVDAPEASHFGRPAQQYASDALSWLKSQIEGKEVYCQLIRKDQYGRVVSIPLLPSSLLPTPLSSLTPFLAQYTNLGKCLSLEMIRAGWGVTYEQANAEYGRWGKEHFVKLEGEAKKAKRGMWKFGTDAESPAEYKRRYAALAASSSSASEFELESQTDGTRKGRRGGWLKRWFGLGWFKRDKGR